MDQFSAHLDRGWDLVQRGDARGAELSARRALEIDSQSPEAYNLLGYVAALEGEFEDAIESYRTAIALDDTYLEAMLNAAEIYVHPLGDFDEAIEMCEQALDLAENDDEIVDALLLKFDALLGKGDFEEAKALCLRFPSGPFENPSHTFLVGRALYEVGDVERAAPLVDEVLKAQPKSSEAWYYMGLIRDERGDTAGATDAFLECRQLDLEMPLPPWTLTRETFEATAKSAVAELEPRLSAFLRPGEVYVSDVPGVEVVVDGVAADARGQNPTARVIVYQRNVERLAGTVDLILLELKTALEREITVCFIEPDEGDAGRDRGLN